MKVQFPERRLMGSVQPDVKDNPFDIPGVLMPVIEFPGVLSALFTGSGFSVFPGTEPVRGFSHLAQFTRTQPQNTAAATLHGVTILSAGLWRLNMTVASLPTFTPATPLDSVLLGNVTGSQASALVYMPGVANTVFRMDRSIIVNIPQDGYVVYCQMGITGAGQTIFTSVCLSAGRIA